MSMEHKAFVFDFEAFVQQLSNTLEKASLNNTNKNIISFINNNIVLLKHPDEGGAIDDYWEEILEEIKDVHNYGDIAITKFYDPDKDIGLGYDWQDIENILSCELLVDPGDIILGQKFGPIDNRFNPGRISSSFQSLEQVKLNMQLLQNLVEQKPKLSIALADLLSMLQKAIDSQTGLYITF